MPRLTSARVRRRGGFTLTELMITVVLFGLVMAALMSVIVRQQRFYRGANEIIDTRTQIRQASSVLPLDLRGISSSGLDIKAMSDTSLQVLATYGTGVVCSTALLTSFVLPPTDMTRNVLTSWYTTPRRGDTVFVYDEAGLRGSEDDQWLRLQVDTVAQVGTGCAQYTTSAESSLQRWRITLATTTPLTSTVVPGAVVRFARPVRYKFYQGGDGSWYLGYQQFLGGSWNAVQPLAGPFRSYSATGASGLRFRYYNQAGALITATDAAARASVARIDLQLRGIGGDANNVALARGGRFTDSLLVRVAVRNRN